MPDIESTVVGEIETSGEHTVVDRGDRLIGTMLGGRFRIDDKLAAGGFGAIYRATHMASSREVAIKVMHSSHAADPNVAARFRREGTTLQRLCAPHTVKTYEFGEAADGTLYIVMELLRGHTLHRRLEHGVLPWRDALAIARAVCTSLAEAHELGVVHRDLKPANIHLEDRPEPDYVKVVDFGIAKIRRGSSVDDGAGDLTAAGQMIGTIDYMSPEQIVGGICDGRCDIYTLGIVMYEMIAGRRPFADATTPTSILAALLTQVPPPVSAWAPVPPDLDLLVARCLQREPHARFATVLDVISAIDAVLAPLDERPVVTQRMAAVGTTPPAFATARVDDALAQTVEVLPAADEEATVAVRSSQPPGWPSPMVPYGLPAAPYAAQLAGTPPPYAIAPVPNPYASPVPPPPFVPIEPHANPYGATPAYVTPRGGSPIPPYPAHGARPSASAIGPWLQPPMRASAPIYDLDAAMYNARLRRWMWWFGAFALAIVVGVVFASLVS